ncbi:cell wall-binding repeat-containing protein [Kineococcus sp. SYSU DK005]|uniref:cell wall-binding repeat-containing protein n=1 Tax=Kineococcus sp. SYSU DK005 TaxID=3383126 RepID=UPI003D7E6238
MNLPHRLRTLTLTTAAAATALGVGAGLCASASAAPHDTTRSTSPQGTAQNATGQGVSGQGVSGQGVAPGGTEVVVPKAGVPFPYTAGLVRAAGADRYETAAIIAQGSFAPSADPAEQAASAVFLTSGEAPADALTAGPAAASLDAPLLLTRTSELPAASAAQLTRLKPATVYVVGGPERITQAVLDAVATAAPGASVQRIAGTDRYATAVAVADRFFPQADSAVIARGDTFPDALSGGAAAAAGGVPLMITEPGRLPAVVDTWLQDAALETAVIVGSTAAVSESVADGIVAHLDNPADAEDLERLEGADRYETATVVASSFFPETDVQFIATGENFPDALAAVPAAALNAAPVLLLPPACSPASTVAYTLASGASTQIVLGGPTSVTPEALLTAC